jgi:hypothetical protein
MNMIRRTCGSVIDVELISSSMTNVSAAGVKVIYVLKSHLEEQNVGQERR